MDAIGQEKKHSSWQKQTHTLTREQSRRLARNIARRLVVACYTKHKVQKHTGTCLPQVSGRRVVVGWKRERTEKTWRVCINTEVVGSGAPGPLIYKFSSTCTSMEVWGRQRHTYIYMYILAPPPREVIRELAHLTRLSLAGTRYFFAAYKATLSYRQGLLANENIAISGTF